MKRERLLELAGIELQENEDAYMRALDTVKKAINIAIRTGVTGAGLTPRAVIADIEQIVKASQNEHKK